MGESNGAWGALASNDPELASQWDNYDPLPEAGANEALDSFCERKRITIGALVRVGARLTETTTLAVAFPDGIKYRDLITDRRWSSLTEWNALKVIPARDEQADTAIVVEGESDAARLTELFPGFDVAVMPAGAGRWTEAFTAQLVGYERVLVATDSDAAGNTGAQKILAALPNAVRYAPPGNDWCDTADDAVPALPDAPEVMDDVVFGSALSALEAPEHPSWFEHDVLPIGGLAMLHGWAKSFKSFLAFDMASAIASGGPWACFEPTEEPARVCVIQFEIAWAYYKARVMGMRERCDDPELWDSNFGSWRPLMRPQLAAGNTKQEDAILGPLVDAGIQVVIFDPVRRGMGAGDMNSEQDVRRMLGFFERLQGEGMTVVATHHDNKVAARSRGGEMSDMTGSGAWAGDPDTIISVSLPRGDKPDSTRRNLNFSLRNSPALGPRSFTMLDDGTLAYSTEAHMRDDEDDGVARDLPSL